MAKKKFDTEDDALGVRDEIEYEVRAPSPRRPVIGNIITVEVKDLQSLSKELHWIKIGIWAMVLTSWGIITVTFFIFWT